MNTEKVMERYRAACLAIGKEDPSLTITDSHADIEPLVATITALSEAVKQLTADVERLTAETDTLLEATKIIVEQADDDRLWFIPVYATEACLQQALRRLHSAIEGKSPDDCARAALQATAR